MEAPPSVRACYPDPGAIFATTAAAYVQYRPGHPRVLLDYVASLAPACNGTRPVLDLGCGPGPIALHLAEHGVTVLAVDPNTDMLAAGQRLAAERGTTQIQWCAADSTRLTELPMVRAVTIGDAFHYMDREQTLTDLDAIVQPGGFLAVLASHALGTPKAWWEPVLDRVRDRHLGTHRRAGPDALFQYLAEDHETVMRRSAFCRLRVLRCDYVVSLTLDELVGLQYTYAFSSLAVLGDRRAAYERDIRAALSAAEPAGQFTATLQAQLIIGQRT